MSNLIQIAKVRYTHDAVIDEIIRNPAISQGELSKMFGFSQAWMSICINSDAFQQRLSERKAEMIDPQIIASINDRLDAVARRSLDKIMDRLEGKDATSPGPVKTAELIQIAKLGVGDKNTRPAGPQIQQNNLYVVALPPPAQNAEQWLNNTSTQSRVGALPIVEEVNRG